MLQTSPYLYLANAVLVLHVAFVLFVVGGLLLVAIGGWRQWRWVKNLWFRLAHLGAIGFVVLESWLGIMCPLTTLEQWLRQLAGQRTYDNDFIAHWLGSILFFEAPTWVFTACYTLFGLAVALSWIYIPPRRPSQSQLA